MLGGLRVRAGTHRRFISLSDQLGGTAFVDEANRLGARVRLVSYTDDMPSVRAALAGLLGAPPRPSAFGCGKVRKVRIVPGGTLAAEPSPARKRVGGTSR